MEKKKLNGNLLDKIVPLVIVLAIVLLILNNFMLFERGTEVKQAREILIEQLRPAELKIIKVTQDNCDFCFDIEKTIDGLKNQNVNLTSEETISSNSQQGLEIISKYGIKKLPTIIVSGEINKSEQLANYFEQKGEVLDNEFIYTDLTPPYFDVLSNKIKGIVQIKHLIDSSCEECVDLTQISSVFKQQGVYIQDEQSIEYNSQEGQALINKFDIKEIPAILISEEVDYYPDVKDALLEAGANKKDDVYAVHSTLPPYRSILQDRIVGLVDVVYLTKEDCLACYDVSINKNILLRFGVTLNKENTYDINSPEGKQLVQKYNIKEVPIIILSPDSKYYPSLVQAWLSVGTIEDDGWFVMRNPKVLGNYWDLESGRVAQATNQG